MDSSEIDSVAANARDALGQVADLLDTQDGGVYVFAGQDTSNPPVPDPDNILTSGFYTQINAAVGSLDPNSNNATDVTEEHLLPPRSPALRDPIAIFRLSVQSTIRPHCRPCRSARTRTEIVGLSASHNGLIPQPPADTVNFTTTGSYMRDVLRALATIGSLSSSQASAPGFTDLVQNTRISLTGAVTAMAQDTGVLGNVQSSLTATQTQLSDTQTALTGQVSSAEDVDMAATMSQLSLVQTQMQASYQLIATLNGLSLAKFLPAS